MDGEFPQLYRNIYREKVKYQFACFGENRRNLTGFQICHSEERSDVGISQYPAASWESYRRNRECLPEIAPQGHFLALRAQGATSACGLLAMTNLWLSPFYRQPVPISSIAPGPAVRSPTYYTYAKTKGRPLACPCALSCYSFA